MWGIHKLVKVEEISAFKIMHSRSCIKTECDTLCGRIPRFYLRTLFARVYEMRTVF